MPGNNQEVSQPIVTPLDTKQDVDLWINKKEEEGKEIKAAEFSLATLFHGTMLGNFLSSILDKKPQNPIIIPATPEIKAEEPILPKNDMYEDKISLGDLTGLRDQYPKEAWSRCNNPAGITWNEHFTNPTPGTLAYDLQQAGISFFEAPGGRGPGEKGSYVGFNTMDDGLKAMVLLRERSGKEGRTISKRLSNYAAVPYKLPDIPAYLTFNQLTVQQKNKLLMEQVKKESGGLYKEMKYRDADFQKLNLV